MIVQRADGNIGALLFGESSMVWMTTRIAFACAGVVLPAAAALADPPPATIAAPTVVATEAAPTLPAPDPERLALAHQITAIALSPEHTDEMVDAIVDSAVRPMQAHLRQPAADNQKVAIMMNDFARRFGALMHDMMVSMMPEITEAMAHAYARQFNRDELTQVLVFAQTPVGAKYLRRAPLIVKDPDVQAVYARMMPLIQARQLKLLSDIRVKAAADAAAPAPTH